MLAARALHVHMPLFFKLAKTVKCLVFFFQSHNTSSMKIPYQRIPELRGSRDLVAPWTKWTMGSLLCYMLVDPLRFSTLLRFTKLSPICEQWHLPTCYTRLCHGVCVPELWNLYNSRFYILQGDWHYELSGSVVHFMVAFLILVG